MNWPALNSLAPGRLRQAFGVMLALAWLLIFGGYVAALHLLKSNAERNLQSRLASDSLILEDHLSRTLDTVSARLESVAAFTLIDPSSPEGALSNERFSPEALKDLIFQDVVIRSLSLVAESGQVIASSNADNLGVILPAGILPGAQRSDTHARTVFGRVYPNRDLGQIGRLHAESEHSVWIASRETRAGDQRLRWLASINLGVFEDFWTRMNPDNAVALAILNYHGRQIAGLRQGAAMPGIAQEILQRLGDAPNGYFDSTGDPRYLVRYRSSERHPMIMATVGDRHSLSAALADQRIDALGWALGIGALVSLGMGLLYRSYRRHEASVVEIANQARAISAHLLVSETDQEGRIIRVNPAFVSASGYSEADLLGNDHRILNSGLYPASFYRRLWETVSAGSVWQGTFRNRTREGDHFWVKSTIVPFVDAWGRIVRHVAFHTDITESIRLAERLQSEQRLTEELSRNNRNLLSEALSDPLTGTANRRAFDAFIARTIDDQGDTRRPIALLLIDLDHFKKVNDQCGHTAGDEVLQEMVRRWTRELSDGDLLARMGGEEFCVLAPGLGPDDAVGLAERLREASAVEPVRIRKSGEIVGVRVTISIGLSSTDDLRAVSPGELMRSADNALYQAKHGGRNRVQASEPIMCL
jgi:diguanylate cyclase (GGDEF)-like protein/PAS domain S-box-containing protein